MENSVCYCIILYVLVPTSMAHRKISYAMTASGKTRCEIQVIKRKESDIYLSKKFIMRQFNTNVDNF